MSQPETHPIAQQDPEAWKAFVAEQERQQNTLELIASENHVSPAVLEATGSIFTNKYAEGYPGRRYYGGCDNMVSFETLAIDIYKHILCC